MCGQVELIKLTPLDLTTFDGDEDDRNMMTVYCYGHTYMELVVENGIQISHINLHRLIGHLQRTKVAGELMGLLGP